MSRSVIGVIDYQLGNQSSVINLLRSLGFKVVFSFNPIHLDDSDILLLLTKKSFNPLEKTTFDCSLNMI